MRMFTGISLPPALRDGIADYIDELAAMLEGIKWVERENLHITLKFLGDVDSEVIPELIKTLRVCADDIASFAISLSSVGAFPSMKYPRVFWVGVEKGNEMVRALHSTIEKSLGEIGFPPEGRSFHPHVTIGRARRIARVGGKTPFEQGKFGEFMAKDFFLYKSTITKKGPIYDIIGKMDLKDE